MENRPYLCPACAKPLIRKINSDGIFWECEGCHHWMTSLTILKKISVFSYVTQLRQDAQTAQPGQGGACPVCVKPMALVPRESVCFQICMFCEMAWLSQTEIAALPVPPASESAAPLPNKAVEIIARVNMQRDQQKPAAFESASRHDLFWFLGIPSRSDGENWKRFPWMTLLILGALFAANGFFNLFGYREWTAGFSLWPGGVRSSLMPLFYVQGGFLNLAISTYLLLLLGTSVENKVRPFHLLAIFVLPSLLGDGVSWMFGTHAGWVVGVNGGMAAVFVFFLFAFPRKKRFWRFANFQAGYSIFSWFLFQLYLAMPFNNWLTGPFYSAHVGGALCGWGYWYFMRTKWGSKRETDKALLMPKEKILKAD